MSSLPNIDEVFIMTVLSSKLWIVGTLGVIILDAGASQLPEISEEKPKTQLVSLQIIVLKAQL